MDTDVIPIEATPQIEVRTPRISDRATSPRSVNIPSIHEAQDGKFQNELAKHAAFLETALGRFLCSRDEFVEQLLSNQRNLIHTLESMERPQLHAANIHASEKALSQPFTPRETNLRSHLEMPISSDDEPFEPLPLQLSQNSTPPDVEASCQKRNEQAFALETSLTCSRVKQPSEVWKGLIKNDSESQLYTRKNYTERSDYEIYIGAVIVASSAYVGWEVQYAGENSDLEFDGNRLGAVFFLVAYSFDLASRLYFDRAFFRFRAKPWNGFDVIVFAVMLLDEFLRLVDFFNSVVVLRILRFLRLLRVLHVGRFVKRFHTFRILMRVVAKSIASMAWVLVLCGLSIYFFALAIAQGSLEHCKPRERKLDPSCDTFGKLSDVALSLFKAMFGGEPWGDLYNRSQDFGIIYPVVILLFISLSAIVIMNVITGVVLKSHQDVHESEIDAAELLQEKQHLASNMQDVFNALDMNVSGGISLDELKYATSNPRMSALLENMGLDLNDVDELFELLDLDHTGSMDIDEFVLGGLRMHRTAKTFDIMKLSMQIENVKEELAAAFGKGSPLKVQCESQNAITSRTSQRGNIHYDGSCSVASADMAMASTDSVQFGRFPKQWEIIEEVEMRAMRIRDLRAVVSLLGHRCTKEKWVNPRTGNILDPNCVNLYYFNYYVISPCSTPQGIYLSGLHHDRVLPGAVVVQKNHMAEKIAQGKVKDVSAGGVINVRVTHGCFQAASDSDYSECRIIVNDEDVGVPSQVEMSICLSYKEAFHPQPIKPMWFCSHWWGEAVCDFLACCEQHAALRAKGLDASYWICAYANRQTEIATDISDDPDSSSFRRAMLLTEGTLLILDDEATPFRRIWCDFELYHTISDGKLLDIVTMHEIDGQRAPQFLSQGLLVGETLLSKTHREAKFPIKSLVSGLNARLEDGAASVQSDKLQILRSITKVRLTGQPGDESALALALQCANATLHSYLAIAAWPQALKRHGAGNHDPYSPLKLGLPEILSRDVDRRALRMSFAHVLELRDADMKAIARSFPPGLLILHLSFEGCSNISDAGMASLGKRIPLGLQELVLDFVGCRLLSDDGLTSLAVYLPQDLRLLRLDFALCSRIGLPGLKTLASNLPKSLVHFAATFQGTEVDRKFDSVQELHKFCKANKVGIGKKLSALW